MQQVFALATRRPSPASVAIFVAILAGVWLSFSLAHADFRSPRLIAKAVAAGPVRPRALLSQPQPGAPPAAAIDLNAPVTSPATPFVLKAVNTAERLRAVRCLTNAVYYEAALEPNDGQRAVAQVVLNRLRDPNFPKSVCGVVYQGWEKTTGCQFSFTCDGSLLRTPIPVLYKQAEQVAVAALTGAVFAPVGWATHYHTAAVDPWWRPSVVRIGQVGAHIFYRWPGAAGEPAAFVERYRGGELALNDAVLAGTAPRPQQPLVPGQIVPGVPGVQMVAAAKPGAPARVHATLFIAGDAPKSSADDIRALNAGLLQHLAPTVAAKPAMASPAVAEAQSAPATAS